MTRRDPQELMDVLKVQHGRDPRVQELMDVLEVQLRKKERHDKWRPYITIWAVWLGFALGELVVWGLS